MNEHECLELHKKLKNEKAAIDRVKTLKKEHIWKIKRKEKFSETDKEKDKFYTLEYLQAGGTPLLNEQRIDRFAVRGFLHAFYELLEILENEENEKI